MLGTFSKLAAALLAIAAIVLACGTTGPSRPTSLRSTFEAPPPPPSPYRIQAGDELEIRFFHTPEQNVTLPVRPDGYISLPLAYEVLAAGRTVEELRADLADRYRRELQQPEVAVILRTFAVGQVHVGGEVGRPGIFDLHGTRTVLQSIFEAGGFLETASIKDVLLVRATDTGYTLYPIDLQGFLNGKDPNGNPMLQPFDVVYVPTSAITNVNRWVDQYIDKNLPINFTYRLDDVLDDDDANN